jgi:hypothetical protein
MQAIKLKLHTRSQHTPALIATAWCVPRSTLECVPAWKKCSKVKKNARFMLPQHFCHRKFLTKWCFASEPLKPWLLTLSTGNSIKARAWEQKYIKMHQIFTSCWRIISWNCSWNYMKIFELWWIFDGIYSMKKKSEFHKNFLEHFHFFFMKISITLWNDFRKGW